MKVKLTKPVIKALRPDPTRDLLLWDTEVKGFGFRLTRNGARSFVFQFGRGSRRVRVTLGPAGAVGALTVAKARKLAGDQRTAVVAGRDPAAERRQAKAEPSLREVAERFLEEHAAHRAPKTQELYSLIVRRHLVPALGTRRMSSVRWEDIARLQATLAADRPVLANRMLAVASKMFALAAKWGAFPRDLPNPARQHDRHPEHRRGRALSREQLGRIGEALDREPDGAIPAACFRLLLLTGTRPSEALQARWQDIDLEARLWRLSRAKTGPRMVYLGAPAVALLRTLPKLDGSVFVFPGRSGQKPMHDLRPLWGRLQTAAELPQGMRLYDATRHTFATWATELGVPRDIRKLLTGHAPGGEAHDAYMHATHEPLRQADRVSGFLAGALRGEERDSSRVLSFPA